MGQTTFQSAQLFFEKASLIEAAKRHLIPKNISVLFRVLDENTFTVRFRNGKIECEEMADEKADLKIEANRNTYVALFEGKISPAEAFHQRTLLFDGIPYIGFPWLTRLIKIIQHGR